MIVIKNYANYGPDLKIKSNVARVLHPVYVASDQPVSLLTDSPGRRAT